MTDYCFEQYYHIGPGRDEIYPRFQKIVTITATTLAQWARVAEARLVAESKGVKERSRMVKLAGSVSKRRQQAEELVDWIAANTLNGCHDMFTLYLKRNQSDHINDSIFAHHDDTCCWYLRLKPSEFAALQTALDRAELPTDVFYPCDKAICVRRKTKSLWRLLLPTWQACYSPKQWAWEQTKMDEAERQSIKIVPCQ